MCTANSALLLSAGSLHGSPKSESLPAFETALYRVSSGQRYPTPNILTKHDYLVLLSNINIFVSSLLSSLRVLGSSPNPMQPTLPPHPTLPSHEGHEILLPNITTKHHYQTSLPNIITKHHYQTLLPNIITKHHY